MQQIEFEALVLEHCKCILQPIRDIVTRWCYTLLMLMRLVELRVPVDTFIQRYLTEIEYIHQVEWLAMEDLIKVLHVSQRFQQHLSKEKTPTDYLPSCTAVIVKWEKLNNKLPH
ncbi:hypothetical protein PM082_020018 [Marasmius tenuissimus]|nr:hypothetical protein PM082_020018 [Marasmius tenuissimus]